MGGTEEKMTLQALTPSHKLYFQERKKIKVRFCQRMGLGRVI